jgi:3-oxoacid CoA-transferase subunit B
VIVLMEHTTKTGEFKIVQECSLPLTGKRVVTRIITDLAVIDVTDAGLVLREIAPGLSVEDVQQATGVPLIVDGEPVVIRTVLDGTGSEAVQR